MMQYLYRYIGLDFAIGMNFVGAGLCELSIYGNGNDAHYSYEVHGVSIRDGGVLAFDKFLHGEGAPYERVSRDP